MSEGLVFKVIGAIRTEHKAAQDAPIQPAFAKGCMGRVELAPEYEEGLKDIDGFSHLILLYHLRQAGPAMLTVKPFLEDKEHGVFATRRPRRPNPIGLSVVRLVKREGNVLFIEDADILDGTPLLDVKPFMSKYDAPADARSGWMDTIDPHVAQTRGRRGYKPKSGPEEAR